MLDYMSHNSELERKPVPAIRQAKADSSQKTDGVKLGVWQRGGGDEAGLQRARETAPIRLESACWRLNVRFLQR